MEECIVSNVYDGKRRTLFLTICERCGKLFYIPRHVNRKFCSKSCIANPDNQIMLSCSYCGSSFIRIKNKLNNSLHGVYFCSRGCKDLGQRVESGLNSIWPEHYGNGLQHYRDKISIETCITCGINFKPVLVVHHIDGDRNNNKPENLEVVCQNCHVLRHLKFENGEWKFSTKVLTPRHEIMGIGAASGWPSHLQ